MPRLRIVLVAIGGIGVAVLLVLGVHGLRPFGTEVHPYGDRAVAASLHQRTANVLASINFDQRGLDTLGEESILFIAALGAVVLLRRLRDEEEDEGATHQYGPEDVFDAVRLVGFVMLPVVVVIGLYVVGHGQVSPGGGFQGGVVLGTGIHMAYLAGDYATLERLRPTRLFDITDAIGAGAYACIALATVLSGAAVLTNGLPLGTFRDVFSGGTVPILNAAVGLEVASAVVLLLAKFLEQALAIHVDGEEASTS